MKFAGTMLLALLAPGLFSQHMPQPTAPPTLVVASLDTSRADAFIGNLRFSRTDLVYAVGRASIPAAQRVSRALGVPVVVDTLPAAGRRQAAINVADRIQDRTNHVVVVLLDADLALPFLRRVTGEQRSSFPLSGAPGRMWIITRANGYMSAIRGAY